MGWTLLMEVGMGMDITLRNGLRVIGIQNPSVHSVGMCLLFRCATIDEPVGEEGSTHMLEHMFFRRSNGIPNEENYRRMNAIGTALHAITTRNSLSFDLSVLPESVDYALEILLDLFQDPKWSEADLLSERKVVRKQIEFNGIPYFEKFCKSVIETGGLEYHSLMGTRSSIRRISLASLDEWRRRTIHPSNACLVVVGPFDRSRMLESLRKFEESHAWKSAAIALPKPPHRPDENSIRILESRSGISDLYLSFQAPDNAGMETEVLGVLLGDGIGSRLFSLLQERLTMTDDILVDYPIHGSGGSLDLLLSVDQKDLHGALSLLFKEIRRLAGTMTGEEVDGARRIVSLRWTQYLDSPQEYAIELGFRTFIEKQAISNVEEALQNLASMTRERLAGVARDLFRSDTLRLIVTSDSRKLKKSVLKELLNECRASLENGRSQEDQGKGD
jgi:predicted Zn-dependent peptidase